VNRILLLTLVSVCIFAPVVRAADNFGWRWIEVRPRDFAIPVTWDVEQGTAKNVEFVGKEFTADLFTLDLRVYPKASPDILLKGTIRNGKIIATATYLGTEADPETFRGTVQKIAVGNGWVTERITLNETGWSFIGITRLVRIEPENEK